MPEVYFHGPVGRLEGKIHLSENKHAPRALLLHPHPLYGGTMNNKVVYTLFKAFREAGFHVLRFNFRGVGVSEGSYDEGRGELEDAKYAYDYLSKEVPTNTPIWIGGFSFGSWVMFRLIQEIPFYRFLGISPPAQRFDFSGCLNPSMPGLIVQGDQDEIVPIEAVDNFVSLLAPNTKENITYKIIPEADHFFTNQLGQLESLVNAYINAGL